MAPITTPKKSRSNTPSNKSNKKNNKTPKTKSRSQTPNHKLVESKSKTPDAKASSFTSAAVAATAAATVLEQELSPETLQAFHDALEDVHTRFILNLPEEELASSDRLFFQIEQAWWFYEDFICDEMDQDINHNESSQPMTTGGTYAGIAPAGGSGATEKKIVYPRYSNLKPFARKMFEISPILNPHTNEFDSLWKDFTKYKRKISTYGTILLDATCTQIVLCQDYQTKSWTLPAGKVNQNEKGIDAAIRETYEETGFDINCESGLTKQCKLSEDDYDEYDENALRRTWNVLTEEDSLVYIENDGSGKRRTCFICHGVPEDFPFAPIVRKEVADIEWHYLDDLPKKTFAVLPFIKGLRKWIRNKNRKEKNSKKNNAAGSSKKKKDHSSRKKDRKTMSNKRQQNQRSGSKGRSVAESLVTSEDDDLVQSGLGQIGDQNRWSEDDMFRANEELIGRKIEYDGNPQQFATKGFDGIDPHAFRIVGGGFMNSGGNAIAKAPEKSKMQPLFRPNDDEYGNNDSSGEDGDNELTPFFNNDGSTPWGEQVLRESIREKRRSGSFESTANPKSQGSADTILSEDSIPSALELEDSLLGVGNSIKENTEYRKSSGLAFLTKLRGGNKQTGDSEIERVIPASAPSSKVDESKDMKMDDVFMTDKEITAKSQKEKKGTVKKFKEKSTSTNNVEQMKEVKLSKADDKPNKVKKSENQDFMFLKNWVDSLPKAKPTKVFGDFHFDVNAIMVSMKTK